MPEKLSKVDEKNARFEVKDCVAEIRMAGLLSFLKRKLAKRHWPVVDLSEDGIQILAREDLQKGDHLRIAIDVPAYGEVLDLRGVVRWVRTAKVGTQIKRIGVEFISPDKKTRQNLRLLQNDSYLQGLNRFRNL